MSGELSKKPIHTPLSIYYAGDAADTTPINALPKLHQKKPIRGARLGESKKIYYLKNEYDKVEKPPHEVIDINNY